jgi:tRNA(fMet)-specific endonuclease VapC
MRLPGCLTLQQFQQFPILSFDPTCEAQYQQLRKQRLRVGSQDLPIAAVARTNNVILVTRNRVIEDWSQ